MSTVCKRIGGGNRPRVIGIRNRQLRLWHPVSEAMQSQHQPSTRAMMNWEHLNEESCKDACLFLRYIGLLLPPRRSYNAKAIKTTTILGCLLGEGGANQRRAESEPASLPLMHIDIAVRVFLWLRRGGMAW
ncbi:hypothetical protein AC579_9910 [Pseudocercospora musae]|uniref:Uncharacterized protein n=1 Tax=Pseudocercospora musae TaxID=113226 RepID=A0A139IF57_9PEZI|nr:hypothetical protein AC579_9910 [Pseudocercospora musae]